MSNYATLKAAVANVIKTNGNKEITGALLQTSLLTMIESLGANYQFAGIATPGTTPGTPDQNVFYIAFPGAYPNFGNAFVPYGSIGVFAYNGTWTISYATVGALENTPVTLTNKLDFSEFGYYRASNGEHVTDKTGDKLTDFIPVIEGWDILVNIAPDDSAILTIVAFDESMNVILGSSVTGNRTNYHYIVPSGVKYIRFGTRSGAAYLSAASVTFPSIGGVDEKIKDAYQMSISGILTLLTNTLDFSIFGYYRWNTQQFVESDGDKVTDYIPVQPGWDILVNISPDDVVTNTITAFDENFNVDWANSVHDNLVNYHYIVPAGVKYLRFGTRSGAAYLEQASVKFPIDVGQSGNFSDIVMDLPVSDGTDIQSGYAYIDTTTRNVKVKQ